ncbi:acetyltransferase [Limosilactobacillus albertensis]|uniref:Acetyltransferase n=1 Tax=Limosilactobacillus albertensis TaxID=2759752 RepID=A0A839H0Y5_9LACO|nr:acetyltransferase [Limosilactobacillus albertensis]MBB1124153.1 acetyltransferase [Limosilactobacillus albertensis]MCD7122057.1 acetyltransferase [Limosilactobacillus albertensis]
MNEREIKQLLSEVLGYQLDDNTKFLLPFYSDYGRNIKIGKNVLISCNVMMADKGGITISNNVEIGAGCSLLSVDGNQSGPIKIDAGAKLGGNVTVLPNVHIGTQAIISAGSIITHDIPAGKIITVNTEGASA